MAYPYNFFGGGANPYGYQQFGYNGYQQYQPTPQMPQQPVMQTAQQNAQPIQPQIAPPSSIIWVRNQNEAALFPVSPNNAVALWDQNAPAVYLKQADASGKPSMKIYDLVERKETASESTSSADGKLPAYATKEELGAVVGAVKGFDEIIGSIKADIDTMKGDIYGVVGKKKAVKKSKDEDVEDDD